MISIVAPYWNRCAATNRALHLIAGHYKGLDFEYILVDDGSREEFVPDGDWPWLHVIKLPRKDEPKNPCVPINTGVRYAGGDIIVLTNPEVLHNVPVLPGMLETLRETGEYGYISAACWYERDRSWHAHSGIIVDGQRDNYRQPAGSAFHFCTMFYRSLWDRAGGFDEEYRDGVGWDDPDWVNRVARAGAVFRIRDDLVVEHVRDGAETNWNSNGTDRNKAIFMRKWSGSA